MNVSNDSRFSQVDWLNRREYPFESRFIEADGGRMHYVDEGSGEPIVFVHGNPGWSYVWRHLIREFRATHRCVAPDHIGFGFSEKPAGFNQSVVVHAHNLDLLVERLGLKDITLVVHDLGGPIGLGHAFQRPENVKRVVYFNTWLWSLGNEPATDKAAKLAASPIGRLMFTNPGLTTKMVRGMFGDKAKASDSFINGLFGPYTCAEDRLAMWAASKQLTAGGPYFDYLWGRRKDLLDARVMMIWGMKSPTFGEKVLNRLWHENDLADVRRLADAGHYPMEENPPEVLRSLKDFMSAPVEANGFMA